MTHKKVAVGGLKFDLSEQGISFGEINPIFLVPTDTNGNVSFTGIIRGVKVIGKFAPASCMADTFYAEDPFTGRMVLSVHDSIFNVKKHGEWDYYCDGDFCFREYYDKGTLIKRDSAVFFFTENRTGITIADSMARIRSVVDLYIKKGNGSK